MTDIITTDILCDIQDGVFIITLNRLTKHNAFDDVLLEKLYDIINDAIEHPDVRVILLNANGKHFSAGADLSWMQRMSTYSEDENINDAMVLAKVMHAFHISPKPTIAMVQGAAFGGGAGLAAACDIAIAADTTRFCFSEIKLGLIPAVISPYVVAAIGARNAKYLFMTGEIFSGARAYELGLVQHFVPEDELEFVARGLAITMAQQAPEALQDCKSLVQQVADRPINEQLMLQTAHLIASKRVSAEGKTGIEAFLNKTKPIWQ